MVRVFTNGPGDRASIPRWVIPNTQKMALDASLLNIQYFRVRIKGKRSNPGKGGTPSITSRCSSYWKGSLRVALDYGRPTYITVVWALPISPYGFFSPLLVLRDFAAREADQYRCYPNSTRLLTFFYVTLSFLCNIICYLISVFAFSLVTLSGATTITYTYIYVYIKQKTDNIRFKWKKDILLQSSDSTVKL